MHQKHFQVNVHPCSSTHVEDEYSNIGEGNIQSQANSITVEESLHSCHTPKSEDLFELKVKEEPYQEEVEPYPVESKPLVNK